MDRRDTLLLACGTAETRGILRSAFEENFNILEADNAQQTVLLLEQNHSCIAAILLDITVSDKLSSKMLTHLKESVFLEEVPVIAITEDDSADVLTRLFSLGATDVIPLHYDPYAMQQRVHNIVELHLHKRHLEDLVEEQAASLRHTNESMVDALSSIIEYRSVESGQHILRIRHFTQILLEEVARSCPEYALTVSLIRIISSASALHDVGKISIPDSILNKPGKLTREEWEVMKTHSLTGCRILESLGDVGDPEYLRYAHNICHYHHERWDGGGYPEGISGDDIPICAQVVGLADVYDALTSKRVYKDAFSFETAVNMILNGECGIFAPKLLECFKHVSHQFADLARAYADGLSPKSEEFNADLPAPVRQSGNTLDTMQTKFLSLLHYLNIFVAEVDIDQGHYHLIYNPYPELASLQDANTLADTERLIMEEIILPEERERMTSFLHEAIPLFLQAGLRRQTFLFKTYSKDPSATCSYEVTALRPNPNDESRRNFMLLWRKLEEHSPGEFSPMTPAANPYRPLLSGSFRCRNDRYFTLINSAPEGIAQKIITQEGYSAQELKELFHNHLIELVVPEDREMLRKEFDRQLAIGPNVEVEYRVRHKSGRIIWILNKSHLMTDSDGQEYIYTIQTDITSTKRAYDDLSKKMERYEIILAQTENVLFEWDVIRDTISFSDTWERIFGFSPIKQDVRAALSTGSYFHPDDIPLLIDRIRALENGASYQMIEVRIAANSGRYLWCRFRASAIRSPEGDLQKIVGIIINIDSEKQAERALQDRAERDALTKLLNKHAARKTAEEYLSQYPNGVDCAMLIIDLDNFKYVNDHYGHMFGDAVLAQSAKEIKKLFRAQDIVARIGGDEFMVMMRGISDRELVEMRCARLVSVFRDLFRHQLHDIPLSCSIGVSLAPEHGISYYDLFQYADQALYQAKNRGKNNYVFYDSRDAAFRSWRKNDSAINTRIDSDEQPGLADSSIVQYAFQRLYTSDDVNASVNDILALVGQQMNVSRVYVFENTPDDRFCNNTFEWCNTDVQPQIDQLQSISYETDIPGYTDLFDEHGIFYCQDVSSLPKPIYDILAPQNIKSMLQCAIRDKGHFKGYIGFDECTNHRMWTKEQIDALTFFSEMLSIFLLKNRAQSETIQRANDLSSILDNQNAWIYVIDPETCRLKFLNAKTRSLAPNAAENSFCYKVLMGLEDRCPDCPAKNIYHTKNASTTLSNNKFGLQVLSEATMIRWGGKEACLLTCRELHNKEHL